jgi:hypothetical protein
MSSGLMSDAALPINPPLPDVWSALFELPLSIGTPSTTNNLIIALNGTVTSNYLSRPTEIPDDLISKPATFQK